MRITYIHQHFATMESSGGVRSLVFSKYLVSQGHKVTIITSDNYLPEKYKNKKRFEIYGIKVINVKTNYTGQLNYRQRIISFLKFMVSATVLALKNPCDLIYATSTPLTVALPGLIVKFFKRVPFVFEVRDLWPDVPIEMGVINNKLLIFLLKLFEKLSYFCADRIVGVSEGICEKISAPAWKKIYIPTGCDLDLFKGNRNSEWKDSAGITGSFLFVYTGAIGIANGLEYLMKAAKILKEKRLDDISIALIGDGSAKEQVMQMKAEYSLDNVFLFDPIAKSRIPDILASADAGIILLGRSITYMEYVTPNKFFDYVAAGLPLIFNFKGPLRKEILESNAGYYVDHKFPEQLSDAMIHAYRNKAETMESGKNARRLAEEKYDQKIIVLQFEELLSEAGGEAHS